MELLNRVFYIRLLLRGSRVPDKLIPCGRGFEYLHLTVRVMGGNRKGSLESETVKYGYESMGFGPENDCAGESQ
jgi:hypothetical protein